MAEPKSLAIILAEKMKGGETAADESKEEKVDGLEAAMEEFAAALKAEDFKAAAAAFRDAKTICGAESESDE